MAVALIAALYLLLAFLGTIWGLSYDNWELKEQLKWVSPLVLEINFVLILTAVLVNLKFFQRVCRGIKRKTWIMVGLIAIGGTFLTGFVAPRTHRLFYDEDIYLNIGQTIASLKKAGMCNEGENLYGEYVCSRLEYNKEPNGWPYLLAVAFRIAGVSHLTGFVLNNLIWGLSILVVFFIGFLLFDDEMAGLFGALIFALIPQGILWSNTTAVEPSAALWAGLAILSVILFVRYREKSLLFLASVLLPFAFQFRAESFLVALPAGFAMVLLARKELKKEILYAFILLLLALALPHLIHTYSVMGEGWGASGGGKFDLKYLRQNLEVNGLFYLTNDRFPALFTLLFIVGLVIPMRKVLQDNSEIKTPVKFTFWKEKTILLIWFLSFWGVFLLFYAGSYNYGADVRFSLVSYMPLAVLAGLGTAVLTRWGKEKLGFPWIRAALTMLIIFWFLPFLPHTRAETQEGWAARADHKYARVMADRLPPESLVLTHNPNMFLLWGRNAAQASIAVNEPHTVKHFLNRYKGGVFFHYNFWCNVSDPVQQSFCRRILARFNTTRVMAFTERNYRYALYRLELKNVP